MNILDYLKQYNKNLSNIEILKSKLATLQIELENHCTDNMKAQILTDMPGGGNGEHSQIEKRVIEKIECQDQVCDYQLRIARLQELVQFVESKMRLCNEDERFLLRVKYIDNVKKYERISDLHRDKFGYSIGRHAIMRKIENAVNKMSR